jgi:putative membrane protein
VRVPQHSKGDFGAQENEGTRRAAIRVMTKYALCIAFTGLLVSVAGAQQNQANRLSSGDNSFVTKAAQGGMAEVELGNLAMQKATDPKVKEFAQRMVTDHTKANDDLKSVAASKGITLPTSLDSKDESTKNRLSGLHGAAFDHAYMEDMVSDHKTDISEFKRESSHGTDPDVKAFATKTLPTLDEHLQLAETTLSGVKK